MTSFYPAIVEAALRALVAAAAVWAGLRIMRVANVHVLKSAWVLVLAAAFALLMAPSWLSLPSWTALKLPAMPALPYTQHAAATPAAQPASAAIKDNVSARSPSPAISSDRNKPDGHRQATSIEALHASALETEQAADATAPQATTSPTGALSGNPFAARIALLCLLLYLGVASALVLRLLLGLASALRLWMTAEPVSTHEYPAGRVRSSRRVASPVNIGSGIVLPAEYSQWDERKLRIVLAHERSHIHQGDFYLQLIAGLYASVFWFSPLGWWLKHRLNELGEAISDRAGIEEADSRVSYAQILLEFAALPRPTVTGVAMARTSHLSQRIERLLNESRFKQAYAASGRRAILAAILVPFAVLAATALVTVQAAAPSAQTEPAALSGQSTPEQVTEAASAQAAAPAPAATPAAESSTAPEPMPAPQAAGVPAPQAPVAPAPPMRVEVPMHLEVPMHVEMGPAPTPHIHVNPQIAAMPPMPPENFHFNARDFAFAYGWGQVGDPYVVVDKDGKMTAPRGRFSRGGGDSEADIEKARKQAHGAFLWFQHGGKSYMIEDPSVLAQIDAMNKPMDDLQNEMRDIGKQMRDFGRQQREKSRAMRDTAVQTPDLSKELAALKAAEASLQAKQGSTITPKEVRDLQREIGRIQGELGSLQGKLAMDQAGMGKMMGEFGEQQGKLGGQMGKLGSEMGRIARENQMKMNDIIKDSLANGKAKQVQQ